MLDGRAATVGCSFFKALLLECLESSDSSSTNLEWGDFEFLHGLGCLDECGCPLLVGATIVTMAERIRLDRLIQERFFMAVLQLLRGCL